MDGPDTFEAKTRDGMVRQLRKNLAKCRRVIMDEKIDLKTRERWTQLYNNTSRVLNQILKDRQMRDWEKRLREIEGWEKEKSDGSSESLTESKTTVQQRDSQEDAGRAAT